MTLELRDLITELNDQANREQDKIELLGAKLSVDIVTRWGLFILLICQFYLWLHLRALQQVATVGDPSLGWIGLYPGFWARTFTVISVLVPSVIAVSWLIRQWGGVAMRWQVVGCVNAAGCLILGLATVSALLDVRRKVGVPVGLLTEAASAKHEGGTGVGS